MFSWCSCKLICYRKIKDWNWKLWGRFINTPTQDLNNEVILSKITSLNHLLPWHTFWYNLTWWCVSSLFVSQTSLVPHIILEVSVETLKIYKENDRFRRKCTIISSPNNINRIFELRSWLPNWLHVCSCMLKWSKNLVLGEPNESLEFTPPVKIPEEDFFWELEQLAEVSKLAFISY